MAINTVIAGDFIGARVGECTINDKTSKVISIFPTKEHRIGEIGLRKGDGGGVINYEIINQEQGSSAGKAIAGGALFGVVGAIVGGASSSVSYTIAIEYHSGKNKKRSLIEIDSNLYKRVYK